MVCLTLLGLCDSAAAFTPLTSSAEVTLSSSRAGATPVALTLVAAYEMQCGYPGPGPVLLQLPREEAVPRALKPSQVLVDGRPAPGVGISGHTVRIGLAPMPRIMCDVIGMGRLTILFTRGAELGNPVAPGSYAITATSARMRLSADFTIRPA